MASMLLNVMRSLFFSLSRCQPRRCHNPQTMMLNFPFLAVIATSQLPDLISVNFLISFRECLTEQSHSIEMFCKHFTMPKWMIMMSGFGANDDKLRRFENLRNLSTPTPIIMKWSFKPKLSSSEWKIKVKGRDELDRVLWATQDACDVKGITKMSSSTSRYQITCTTTRVNFYLMVLECVKLKRNTKSIQTSASTQQKKRVNGWRAMCDTQKHIFHSP